VAIQMNQQQFVAVSVDTLRPPAELNFDLYMRPVAHRPARLYRSKDVPIDDEAVARLLGRGIHTLYIATESTENYCDYLRQHVLADEALPVDQRYNVLRQAAVSVLGDAFQRGCVDSIVSATENVGSQVVELLAGRETILRDLIDIMVADYSTYAHATNVATYAVMLARALGISDQREIVAIGQGALLHDMGKQFIENDFLNSPERLTEDKMEVVRQHPARGFEEVCTREDLSWGQLMMIYQHHELYGGDGYPVGLVGEEIHPWARLCAIVDVFEALTCNRPYRKAYSPATALQYLSLEAGRRFDEEMVQCFNSTISKSD